MTRSSSVPKRVLGLLLLAVGLTSCEKTDEKAPLQVPRTYDASGFTVNTKLLNPIAQELNALSAALKRGRTAGVKVTDSSLKTLFEQGTLSLGAITTPYYISRLEASNGYFVDFAKASGGYFNPFSRGGEGGVYGGYLFDENGLEVGQVIEKGLLGAALYNYAVSLTNNALQPANVDQMVWLYGADAGFVNSNDTTIHANADRFLAAYAAQRDPGTSTGLYTAIRDAFIKLQSAVVNGDDYVQQRNEALAALKANWEKAAAATVIHNLQTATTALQTSNLSDPQRAAVLHTISEAVGLLHGWRTIDLKQKTITDAQIDEVLLLMDAPYDRGATMYLFVTNPTSERSKLTQAIARLQTIYGFTSQEIESFKTDWVTQQQR